MKKKYFVPEMEEFEMDALLLLDGSPSDDGTQDPTGENTGGDSNSDDY